jgi:hypothetical protein
MCVLGLFIAESVIAVKLFPLLRHTELNKLRDKQAENPLPI